jgi:hypothetical protein
MLQIITDSNEINSCHGQLHKRLVKALTQRGMYSIGYQGGNFDDDVHYNADLWFASFDITEGNSKRHWNGFGTTLTQTGSNSIIVEINIPLSGVNRRVSGLFAKDPTTGDVFLLHRGGVGGGRKGIGRDTFTNWYRGKWVEIDEGEGFVNSAILVTALNASTFFENLLFFVKKVADFKRFVSSGEDAKKSSMPERERVLSYKSEFSGIKSGKRPSSFVAECNHGRIVDALEAYLRQKRNLDAASFFNNCAIDLGISEHGKIAAIYEVKTSADTQSIYTGIGQLMIHGATENISSTTLVLPHVVSNNHVFSRALKKLGVSLLEYELVGKEIRFVD